MLIKVVKTTRAAASEIGNSIIEYRAGETYDIFNELGKVFLSQGWGELAEQKAITKAPENKAIFVAPENKMFDDASEEDLAKEIESETAEAPKKRGRKAK